MSQTTTNFDVIIIGGGISGLTCGNYLVRSGKKVLIVEHNSQVGGNMSGIRRKGFFFDCGDQSTESVGILFPILKELGLYDPEDWYQAKWRIVTPDCDVPLDSFGQIRSDFEKFFPDSKSDIRAWFEYLESGCMVFKEIMESGPFPLATAGKEKYRSLANMFKKGYSLSSKAREAISKTGTQKCREIFANPKLAFLFGEFGYTNMLLFMFFSFWYCFLNDYWHPKGGLQSVLEKMASSFQEKGGNIILRETVDRILTRGSWAYGVETSNGERFFADRIINTGNVKRLYLEMVDRSLIPYKLQETIRYAPVTKAVSSAFLGVDISDEELKRYMGRHHVLYWRSYSEPYDNYDPDVHRKGWSQINWTSMRDKSLAPEGKNSIVIQTFTPYDWMNGWQTSSKDPYARTESYYNLKEKVLEDMIKDTEYVIPDLSRKVVFRELGTPRSLSRFTLNPEGSTAGWSYDIYRIFMYPKFGMFTTPVRNLFLAGHYSIWPGGVVFSALSGKIVSKGIYEGFKKALLF